MDFIKLLLFVSFSCVHAKENSCPAKTEPGSCETVIGRNFTQKLDHFDSSNIETFEQRYFVNTQFHKPGGPAFIYIGGEGEAKIDLMMNDGKTNRQMWIEWAKKHGALAFLLEHRYYGTSFPTDDLLRVENLKYLTSEQALADLAAFRDKMAEIYNIQSAKWIVFGYSYAGSLAAWLVLKYPPDKFHGAVASSAPLLAKVNFLEYLEVVSKVINNTNIKCDTAIRGAIMELEALVATPSQADYVTKIFNLCTPLDKADNKSITNLYIILHQIFKDAVQNDNSSKIIELCNNMTNRKFGKLVERYANVTRWSDCLDNDYNHEIRYLKEEALPGPGERQWMYQSCNEFGFFQTTDSASQPFGDNAPINFFLERCEDIFGVNFSPDNVRANINKTNEKYGGNDIRIYQNLPVIFPNGGCDPWSELGIKTPEFFVECSAHCGDCCDPSDHDCKEPPECRKQREAIAAKIEKWLKP